MIKHFLALTFAICWALPVSAETKPKNDPLAFARNLPLARRACFLQELPAWNSGVTHAVIQANGRYRDCLLNLAEEALQRYYPKEVFQGYAPREKLEVILQPLGDLAYVVQTQLKACSPTCGTMWQMVASGKESRFLEVFLQDLAERVLSEEEQALWVENPLWQACWKEPEKCPSNFDLI